MTRRLILLLCLLIGLLAACNGDDEGGEATTTTDPNELINSSAQKLQETTSFQLELTATGTPVVINLAGIGMEDTELIFQRAEGTFVAPDKMQANVTVTLEEVGTEVQVIAVGADQYINHQLLTLGQWQQQTFADFNPADLVSAEQGIANAVRSMQNPTYVGEDDLDGIEVHHIRGQIDASLVRSITVGLIGTETGNLNTDLYIRQQDGLLERLVIEEPIEGGEPTIWTIGLYGYNDDYSIATPEVQ